MSRKSSLSPCSPASTPTTVVSMRVARDVAPDELGRAVASIRSRYCASSATRKRLGARARALALLRPSPRRRRARSTRESRLADKLVGELDGEAVGVVQFEGDVTRKDRRATLERPRVGPLPAAKARAQRSREAGLFALEHLDDEVAVVDEGRVGGAQLLDRRVHERLG